MNENILAYVLIVFIIIIIIKIYTESDSFNLKCVISDVDGNTYCVRERAKLKLVADLLATVTLKLKKLVKHMEQEFPDRDNVKRLCSNFNPQKIYETLPTSKHTAYSENKGEKLAFCLNRKKGENKLIDMNTLMYVALHELSHVGSKSIGHTDEFWQNFKFLIEESKKIGIYNPENYTKEPARFCGTNITDNPYYDL